MGERKFSDIFEATVTNTIGTYSPGFLIGELMTLTDVDSMKSISGVFTNITVGDLDQEAVDLDLVIFTADPVNTTFTDFLALDIDEADIDKIAGNMEVRTDFSYAGGARGTSEGKNQNIVVRVRAGINVFAACVSRGAPTYTRTDALNFRFGFLED